MFELCGILLDDLGSSFLHSLNSSTNATYSVHTLRYESTATSFCIES
jgi:hypothetical protein